MKYKTGVNSVAVAPEIFFALGVAEKAYGSFELVVTSLRDGQHHPDSLHYAGYAADLRIKHIASDTRDGIFMILCHTLNKYGFDVVLESNHIHIEYQPKLRENFVTIVE